MSAAGGLVFFVVFTVVPRIALPVNSFFRRIIVESFPPNGVVFKVMNNVCENSISLCCCESVGVGFFVCTRSDTEETILGVYRPQTSVGTDSEPSYIVTYAPYFVAFFSIEFRRNKHSEVGFSAS